MLIMQLCNHATMHMKEQPMFTYNLQIHHVNYCVQLSTLRWATISHILMCTLDSFFCNNAIFSHTLDLVDFVHLDCIFYLYRNQYFKAFFRQNIQQKLLVFYRRKIMKSFLKKIACEF